MVLVRDAVQFIFSIALFINALIFIPQSIHIIREKSAKGVSLLTFLGLLLIQLAIVLHGIIVHDLLLIWGYIASMVTTGSVVMLTFVYKNKNLPNSDSLGLGLEEILAQLPGHVYWKDKDCVFIGGNTNNWKDFGLKSLNDYLGKTDYDIFSKEEADRLRAIDEEVIRTGLPKLIEEILTDANGKKVSYLSQKIPLKDKKNRIIGILGVSTDITAPKQETMEKLDMLENIIAIMPGTVYWMDRNGVYLGCNDNEAKAIGLSSRKDIIGKKNVDLPGFLIPEVLDPVNEKVMTTGKSIMLEEPATLQDGTRATFLSSKVPLFNNKKEITGMVGISIDITDRKNLEEERYAKEVLKQQLNAAELVGAAIAHELRTPLLTILICLRSIKNNIKNRGSVLESILAIENEVNKSNEIINIMLTKIQRHENIELEETSINECIIEAINRFPYSSGDDKALIKYNTAMDFKFMGEKGLMVHVVFNLIKNALYSIYEAGKGEIRLSLSDNDNFNVLEFKDTGTGIKEENKDKIFKKFFTTTKIGSGVGLSFCKYAIGLFGGSIEFDSVYGEHTTFTIYFPKIKGNLLNNEI